MITRIAFALMCTLMFACGQVRAASCSAVMVPDTPVNTGFWCSQSWIDFFWDAYDFDKGDWDQGFGWDTACDTSRPLARTFQAILLLSYAAPVDATTTGDFSGNILHWGGNYAIREIDELDARCGDGTTRASTAWGGFDDYTELYLPFFYNENVVERAATILHEARHADWCGHNGNDGSNKCPARSDSCDEDFDNGCGGFASPSGRGAGGFQALWLWWYSVEADNVHSSGTMKAWARDEANRIFNTMLDKNPCFNITANGSKIITC